MNEWPGMEEELELNRAMRKLVEATDALKNLPILRSGAAPEERLEWQNELAEVKRLIQDAQNAFQEKSDALLRCKEEFAGHM